MSAMVEATALVNSPLERLELALQEQAGGGKSKLQSDIREAYPIFAQHVAQKMRKRKLMEQFNLAYEHDLDLIQFRKLLNAERDRRAAAGDALPCPTCGQLLHGPSKTGSEEEP